ncbi:MAG: hypothetical protein VX434_08025 [Pseudomonadota bacterium]|nr:hypothetical protein [Pseudomonadota bacterium]
MAKITFHSQGCAKRLKQAYRARKAGFSNLFKKYFTISLEQLSTRKQQSFIGAIFPVIKVKLYEV